MPESAAKALPCMNRTECLNSDGVLILSGILEERCHEILASAEENGFVLVEKIVDNDWCGLALRLA